MAWYEKLLDTVKDVAPIVAGGATTVLTGGNIALGSVVSSVIAKVMGKSGVDSRLIQMPDRGQL